MSEGKGRTMRCKECGSEVAENDVFCGSCGAEIIPGAADERESDAVQEERDAEKKKSSRKKKKESGDRKKAVIAARIFVVLVIAAVIIFIIVYAVISARSAEGRRIFDKMPLGRDVEKISADTGEQFITGENSLYGALNYIADYDYLCESEKNTAVGGIMVPEWAVLLSEDGAGNIDRATLYNFYILKHNWMGEKSAERIDISSVEFGMKAKEAERRLGLKPYAIVKNSTDNTETYTYRYHYTDEESGNNRVMNFYVVISDVDGQVKNVYDEQLDYLNLILNGTSAAKMS